jgi:hypothetical protein
MKMDELEFEEVLEQLVEDGEYGGFPELDGMTVRNFYEAGLMTNNRGLVVTLKSGDQFQLTIVRSK